MAVFDDTCDSVKQLASKFDNDARSPTLCIRSLGLEAHPSLAEYLTDSGQLSPMAHVEAAAVIYKSDCSSITRRYPPFEQPPLPPFVAPPDECAAAPNDDVNIFFTILFILYICIFRIFCIYLFPC